MPSKFTSNFNLSQWEANDKVLRTDFNADNAKIDAALRDRLKPEIICQTGDSVNQDVFFDLEDINWNDWLVTWFSYRYTSGTSGFSLYAAKKDGSSMNFYNAAGANTLGSVRASVPGTLILFPFYQADRPVTFFQSGNAVGFGVSETPFSDLGKIIVGCSSGSTFPKGYIFTMWGIR